MSGITTHVLDTARGRPAAGVPATLEMAAAGGWKLMGKGVTNADGRIADLVSKETDLNAGSYRLIFDTEKYFAQLHLKAFYPLVTITFRIEDPSQHYHVPLIISPFGYSTYRGA